MTQEIAAAPAIPDTNAPSTAGMTTRVVKGSLWTLAGQVLPLAVSLFATPFVIRLLGSEGYGVLILVGLIPTYFGFADFGMSLASTKFSSEAYAANDREREARVVRTAAVIAFLVSLPIALAIAALSGWIVTLFNMPERLQAEAALALKFAAVTFVVNFLNGIFNAPEVARLRMDLNTLVTSGFRIMSIIAAPIVIFLGGGIVGAVIVLMIASLLTLGGHIYISGRLLPPLFDFTIDRGVIRPLVKFGAPVALTLIAAAFLINLEKAVLARVTDVRTLAYYSVAFNFAGMATMFSLSVIQSLTPAFAQLLTPEKRSQLNGLYARAIRMNTIVVLPLLAVMFVAAKPLFTLWAGPEFGERSTIPFYILLTGLFFNLLAYVSQALLIAAGRTDVIAKVNWLELIPYIALTAILSYRFGAVGAALAWSLRVLADCFVIIWLADKLEGTALPVASIVSRLAISLTVLAPAAIFAVFVNNWSLWVPVITGICCLAYAGFVWKFAMEENERSFFAKRGAMIFSTIRGLRANA